MNRWVISGLVVTDPIAKQSRDGKPIAILRVSVREERKGKDGRYGSFIVSAFAYGATAQFALNNAPKGTIVAAIGRLSASVYTRSGSEPSVDLNCHCDALEILDKPKNGDGDYGEQPDPVLDEEDMPF